MSSAEIAALLEAAPDQHSQRCAVTKSAIDASRWPAAACGLRDAANEARDWANQVQHLADWCDAQVATVQSTAAALAPVAAVAGPATLEALEAGLMALANGLGPDHSARVLEAISSSVYPAPASNRLPAEAALIGGALDHDSLEQGEPA